MSYVRGHYRRTSSGMTYVQPHYRAGGSTDLGSVLLAAVVVVGLVLAFVVAIFVFFANLVVTYAVELSVAVGGLGALVGLGYLSGVIVRAFRNTRARAYLELCRALAEDRALTQEERSKLSSLSESLPPDLQSRVVGEEGIYQDFIARILADGEIDEQELATLKELEQLFGLQPAEIEVIKDLAFGGLLEALRGHFDEEEEARARAAAARLGLSPEHIDRQMQPLVEAREQAREDARLHAIQLEQEARVAKAQQDARERQYRLAAEVFEADERKPIETRVKLSKRETAWYVCPAVEVRELKKGARRKSGRLLVTSRRVLFLGDGNVTVPLKKILDVSADLEAGMLRIIKDGRKSPIDFELDLPLVASAHIDRSVEDLQ